MTGMAPAESLGPDQEIPGSPNRDPDSRFPPNRETGDFPIPVPGRVGNWKFPPRFPAKPGIGGAGTGDFRVRARRLSLSVRLGAATRT